MLRLSREVGSGTVKALTLLRAAQRIERSLVTGSHTWGYGFCTGWGKTAISRSVVVEADPELQPPAADHVQHRRLLGDAQRMPPGQNIRHLAEPDPLRPGRDGGLRQERIGAELRPLGHEVMLGHEPVVVPELVGQDSLPQLADQDALIALVDLLQRAVVYHDPARGGDRFQVGGAIVEDADLDGHGELPSARSELETCQGHTRTHTPATTAGIRASVVPRSHAVKRAGPSTP